MKIDPSIWYVVANRTDTVIYSLGRDRKLRFLHRLTNTKGHKHEHDLVSDKAGSVAHHALDRRHNHHEHTAVQFAGRIADVLRSARCDNLYSSIVLVAEPHFLGLLREALDPATRALVSGEIPKEFTRLSDDELQARILKSLEEQRT